MTDHVERAEQLLAEVGRPLPSERIGVAQVHAQLGHVQALSEVASLLEEIRSALGAAAAAAEPAEMLTREQWLAMVDQAGAGGEHQRAEAER